MSNSHEEEDNKKISIIDDWSWTRVPGVLIYDEHGLPMAVLEPVKYAPSKKPRMGFGRDLYDHNGQMKPK